MKSSEISKILIIPEQYVMLLEKMKSEQKEAHACVDILRDSHKEVIDMGDLTHPIPRLEQQERDKAIASLQATRSILSNYSLVDTYSQDTIEIGTRFQMLLTDSFGKETIDGILIHKRVADEPIDLFISCDTQLGINLKGHKVGDTISFSNTVGEKCTVEILKIYADRLGKELESEKTMSK